MKPSEPLRVLFVTSEVSPWSKTGGLADVSSALPAALRALDVDVRVLTPRYASVPTDGTSEFAQVRATNHLPAARLLTASLTNGVPALLLDCPPLYIRPGGPYQNDAGHDWDDNALRFGQLSRVAAELATDADALPWRPHVVHCNDWQTGLAPAYLRYMSGLRAASVFTLHNLAFRGLFSADVVHQLGLPAESFGIDGLEFYGHCSFLKGGLSYADALTTVSPTYAQEIQSEAHGMGLNHLLLKRRDALTGILNGIDTELWDPARDPHIAGRYDAVSLERKRENKRALQALLGLPAADIPLLAMISRLTTQKGIDLVLEIGGALARLPAQLVVLGRGEAQFEQAMTALVQSYPQSLSTQIRFDETLAHLIEAGADAFLMPSRFEPCGLNQMYSQRYGTLPIVRATGGLVDSVEDFLPTSGNGTGFVFEEASGTALLRTIERAISVYRDPPKWRQAQRNAMARDFSWGPAAARYLEIYERVALPKPRSSDRARSGA